MTAETVANQLSSKARKTSGQWLTTCPAHDDTNPSLTIRDRPDGGLVVHCKTGCTQQDVIHALAELGIIVFPVSDRRTEASGNIASLLTKGFRLVKAYPYTDEQGRLLYENVRLETGHNGTRQKTFRQRRPTGRGGYVENLAGVRRVPYRLADLVARPEQDVHACEGEKDADRLAGRGLLSTSVATPGSCDMEVFLGRTVYVHEDNDRAGKEKAAKLAAALAGIAASVTVVRYPDAGDGGDVSDWLDGGHDLEALLARCEGAAETKANGRRAALEFDDEIKVDTSVNALVKHLLHPGDIAALYGTSGVGKTFCAIDLAYHIALGRSWNGRRVRQAPVLYVGLEGVRGLRHRMVACAQQMGSAEKMLARLTVHAPLDRSQVGADGERQIIDAAKALTAEAGRPCGLIVIDTLARAIAGDDENSAQDMAAFVGRLHAIEDATGAAVLVVHHPGKDDARGMRGSTALFAALDAVIKITANGNVREVSSEKVKDGVIGPLFSYQLKPVTLGVDEDGDDITSCILEAVHHEAAPRRKKLSAQHQRAYDQLVRLYTDGVARCIAPEKLGLADIDPRCNPRVVTREEWRKHCEEAELTTTGNANSERAAFKRAVDELENAGLIARFGDYVWLLWQKNTAAVWSSQESKESIQ